MTTVDGDARLVVLPSSISTLRTLGHVAWNALEVLALRARRQDGAWTVDANVRSLAADLGVCRDRSAAALRCLVAAGLVDHRPCRAGGRYTASGYVIDAEACRRAGLGVEGNDGAGESLSGLPVPCPVDPDTACADTVRRVVPSPSRVPVVPDPDSRSQPSLFDVPTPTADHLPTTPPEPERPQTQLLTPAPTSFPLTTPNRPDALAPGVPGTVFSPACEVTGNLNGGCRPC